MTSSDGDFYGALCVVLAADFGQVDFVVLVAGRISFVLLQRRASSSTGRTALLEAQSLFRHAEIRGSDLGVLAEVFGGIFQDDAACLQDVASMRYLQG